MVWKNIKFNKRESYSIEKVQTQCCQKSVFALWVFLKNKWRIPLMLRFIKRRWSARVIDI